MAQVQLPAGSSRFYSNLMVKADPAGDPIAAQILETDAERIHLPYETPDPIGDSQYSVGKRLIHHYHDRVLLLANDRCATYCRHCFRRHFTGNDHGKITEEELTEAIEYLKNQDQVQEMLISGGDPLMLTDQEIERVLAAVRLVKPHLVFRLATRMLVVLPQRFTPKLLDVLEAHGPLWVVTHANHPRELTGEMAQKTRELMARGIPVVNQAVLLKGVNDDPETLEKLFRGLQRMGIKPYYLFQGDLASGTSHFRTNLMWGIQTMEYLKSRLSTLAMPTFAVDLPGASSKLTLYRERIVDQDADWYHLRHDDGTIFKYPVE